MNKPPDEKITRLEVINHATNDKPIGRILTLYKERGDFENIELSYQDGGRTLKIFRYRAWRSDTLHELSILAQTIWWHYAKPVLSDSSFFVGGQ